MIGSALGSTRLPLPKTTLSQTTDAMNRSTAQYPFGFVLLILLLVCPGLAAIEAGQPAVDLQVGRQIMVDAEAWKWNWASWDQEKIVSFGRFQYTVFWNSDRVMVLARRDLRDDSIQTVRLPKFTLTSDDRHRNTCLGVSAADGRLHLSWDHHNDQLRYTKTRAGFLTEPAAEISIDQIEPAQSMLGDPKLEQRVTYPRFFTDPSGTLFCFYRIGGSGNGDNYLQRYNPADGTWARVGMVFSHRGTYGPWNDSTSRCVYLHDLLFDSRGRLHATWTYREAGASWASNHDLHYAHSDDGGATWRNNAGRQIADLAAGDPIELADPGIVVREIPVYSWLMNAGCMGLDSKDRPHVLTYQSRTIHRPEKLAHDPPPVVVSQLCFVHFWRQDDGTWAGGEPIDPGSDGRSRVDMVFDKSDNLIFFYPTYDPATVGFRYFTAGAADQWQTWSGPHQLTGAELGGRDASKHDRVRWAKEGILSFTAMPEPNGFAILEVVSKPNRP